MTVLTIELPVEKISLYSEIFFRSDRSCTDLIHGIYQPDVIYRHESNTLDKYPVSQYSKAVIINVVLHPQDK